MSDENRIHELLEEALDSNRTPEDVCAHEPELASEVRARWERMRRLAHHVDALFPADASTSREAGPVPAELGLPRVEGYEVVGVLGRGGMGVVFKARQVKLNRFVALKTLLAGAYAGPEELARFRREAEAVATLRHPHIVQIHDVGEVSTGPYFTMELVDGGSLAQAINGCPQPPRHAAALVASLACGVQFAHKSGFIHRDLKPGNVLLSADGVPKITDFGLARQIDAGPEFTLTGARMGTPSYMAPEQALGKTKDIGPAVDIYALGGVLYEMLTGKPPFQGESASDTERRVIHEEPTPPRRLNPRIPRDLETICLKCLQKEPTRRYASAQDVSDDLHRFLDGKPVIARPVGMVERTMKWARRRPALATLAGAVVALLSVAIGLGLWMQYQEDVRRAEKTRREERAREAVESALGNAYSSARAEQYPAADNFLKEASGRLAEAASGELEKRVAQAERDVQFARGLKAIRSKFGAVNAVNGFFVPVQKQQTYADLYAEAFAGKFDVAGDAAALAEAIRASKLPGPTIAALDHWALAVFLLGREPLQKKLLAIARLADPDPDWRDRFRDPKAWRDEVELLRLVKKAFTTPKPPTAQQLAILGTLLSNLGAKEEEIALLHRAVLQRPSDFLLRWELARALTRSKRDREAAAHMRVVLGLLPRAAWTENQLGCMLCVIGGVEEIEEGIEHLRAAQSLNRDDAIIRYNIAEALSRAGRVAEAREECQKAIKTSPTDPWAYHALGRLYMNQNRAADAVPFFEKAVEFRPHDKGARFNLAFALKSVGRLEEALAQYRTITELQETNLGAHAAAAHLLLKLRRYEPAYTAFARVVRGFDEARDRTDVELDEKLFVPALIGAAEALLGLGRFAEAGAVAQRALDLPSLSEAERTSTERCLDIAQRLTPHEGKATDLAKAADMMTRRRLAEWLYKYKQAPFTAAQVYDTLLSAKAPLDAQERTNAGFAAALTGFGVGADASSLDDAAKAAWRKKALAWLEAEQPRPVSGAPPTEAIRSARAWEENDDLAALREERALASLPEAERTDWRRLWGKVKALAAIDPLRTLDKAREHVTRKQWAAALGVYERLFKTTPTASGEVWFEYAAVQLLMGDHEGYRQSCKFMLETVSREPRPPDLRGYHVARACTLTRDPVDDAAAAEKVSAEELEAFRSQFWALTEEGALHVRGGRSKSAVPLLMESLKVEPRPGAAVVNWLWLSLAHHELGADDEARRWLKKAAVWLDYLGPELPPAASSLGLHRHNWLEAQILRREAEALLLPGSAKGDRETHFRGKATK